MYSRGLSHQSPATASPQTGPGWRRKEDRQNPVAHIVDDDASVRRHLPLHHLNAYGRNNFITFEIHGDKGSIAFNYERMDELEVMFADDTETPAGVPHGLHRARAPLRRRALDNSRARHRLTKIIECFDFLSAVVKGEQPSPNFRDAYRVSLIADAILRSGEKQADIV
jgi:predicted dehydrogenase